MSDHGIDRRRFLRGSAAAAGSAALSAAAAGCAAKSGTCPASPVIHAVSKRTPPLSDLTRGRRPNILFIMTDQERWPGNLPPTLERPNMERLKRNAVSFENTFASYPLCSPSRSAMFTGRFPHQTGITQNMIFPVGRSELDPRAPHIGSVLASAGYRIGYKGKWDLSKGPTYYLVNLKDRGRAGPYGYQGHCGKVPDQEYGGPSDDQAVRESCEWIKARSHDTPWFLCCSIINPHDICHPQLKPDDSIRPDVVLPESLSDDLMQKPADQRRRRDSRAAHVNTMLNPDIKPFHQYQERDWKLFLSFYYDLIEMTDGYIGRLLDALEETGSLEDTVIVYHSDHGELGGAHGFSGKYEGYEEDLHVPLYIYHPGLEARQVDTMVNNTSVGPTIAGLAGVEWPGNVQGRDLTPWLTGEGPRADAAFSENQTAINLGVYRNVSAMRMIRVPGWKYSYSFYDVQHGQLYDLQADPHEMNNLFNDPAHRGIQKELGDRLRAWMRETGDAFELPA